MPENSLEIAEYLRGWHNAGAGIPFNEHESHLWRDGWSFFHQTAETRAEELARYRALRKH